MFNCKCCLRERVASTSEQPFICVLISLGRFTDINSFRVTDGSRIFSDTVNDEGNYSVNGSTVTLTYDTDGTVYTASVTGDTMTLYDSEIGLTFVYQHD